MKIKFLTIAINNKGEIKKYKKLCIVYKTYKVLHETFYAVKARKYQYCIHGIKNKYAYVEAKTGYRLYFYKCRNKLATEKEIKKHIRNNMKIAARKGIAKNLHELINKTAAGML